MAKVLILTGPNHGFDKSAPVIYAALAKTNGVTAKLTDDKGILTSPELTLFDVCLLGTGFTRSERAPDGTSKKVPDLSPEQESALLDFVRGGKGFVGVHGSGWWIGGEAVSLIGGSANWHPPQAKFTVQIDDRDHPVTRGIEKIDVDDEIYMSAWDPRIQVLASAEWSKQRLPMAWVHAYGKGRVFYTTLGHSSATFEVPEVQRLLANAAQWAAGG